MVLSCNKKTISLIKRITSKNNGYFYCLNCLHSFRTKNKLESHKNVCENKDFCNIIMPSEGTKIIKVVKNLIKHHLFLMQFLNV